MGGKGGGGVDWASQYDPREGQAYLQRYPDVAASGMDPGQHYYTHGQNEGRIWGLQAPAHSAGGFKPYDFFGDAMSGMHAPDSVDMNAQFEANMQAQQDALAQQEAERRRIEGENRRDALYSSYLDAGGSASDYINAQINQELANARLLGIDFNISDEAKQTRINDYFGSIWGEGQQQELEALMGEWGSPKGFNEWIYTRGTGETLEAIEGEEETVGASKGMRPLDPATILTEEEDVLGAGGAVLGGA